MERLENHGLDGRRLRRASRPAVCRAGAVLFFAALCWSAAAQADVLDISPSGSVTTYDAPSIFRSEGVQPIVAVRPVARLHAMPAFAAPTASRQTVDALLTQASNRYALRPNLLTSVAWQESHFQSGAVSPKGAVGVMQLMDGTARDLGVNRFDLSQNIFGGAAYLKQMLQMFGGNEALALAAYNAGPGAVLRAGGMPQIAETRAYVGAILGSTPQLPSMILFDR